jgi:hypothetical protein
MEYDGRIPSMESSKTLRISPLPRQLAIDIVKRFELAHDAHMNDLQPIDVRLHPCRRVPRHRLPSFPTSVVQYKYTSRHGRYDWGDYEEGRLDHERERAAARVEWLYAPTHPLSVDESAVQLWLTFQSADDAARARYSLYALGLENKRFIDDVCSLPIPVLIIIIIIIIFSYMHRAGVKKIIIMVHCYLR